MTFDPVLPWAILAVVAGALALARLVALRQVMLTARRRRIRAVLRWSGVTVAVLLLIAATTRPGLRREDKGTRPAAGENLNVFLVVDRSADSDVRDYGASGSDEPRIAGMRADISALTKQYPGARYALVGFSSAASLEWPLSADVWSLAPTVAAIRTRGEPTAESNVDAAAASSLLRYQLIQAVQQYSGSRNVVLYFGSGAPASRVPQGDFDLTHGSVGAGAVLGYGRSDAMNEPELRRIAEELQVPYTHRDAGQPFRLALPPAARTGTESTERTELYWLPAVLATALLLTEIYLSVRQFRRGRIARRDPTS